MNRTILTLTTLAGASLLGGCVGPTSVSDGTRASATGSNGSTARSTNQYGETWETATGTGQVPTNLVMDRDGAAVQSYGNHRVMTLAQGDSVVTFADPLDGSLKGLRIHLPDGTIVELDELINAPSDTIAAYNEQVITALQINGHITSEQAATARDAIAAGATLAEALAGSIIPLVGG